MNWYLIELGIRTYLDPVEGVDPFLSGNVPELEPEIKRSICVEDDTEVRIVAKEIRERLNSGIQDGGGVVSWYEITAIYKQIV